MAAPGGTPARGSSRACGRGFAQEAWLPRFLRPRDDARLVGVDVGAVVAPEGHDERLAPREVRELEGALAPAVDARQRKVGRALAQLQLVAARDFHGNGERLHPQNPFGPRSWMNEGNERLGFPVSFVSRSGRSLED